MWSNGFYPSSLFSSSLLEEIWKLIRSSLNSSPRDLERISRIKFCSFFFEVIIDEEIVIFICARYIWWIVGGYKIWRRKLIRRSGGRFIFKVTNNLTRTKKCLYMYIYLLKRGKEIKRSVNSYAKVSSWYFYLFLWLHSVYLK